MTGSSLWVFRAPLHRDRLVQGAACLAVLHGIWVVHTSVSVPSSILRVVLGIPSSLYLVGVTLGTIRAYRHSRVAPSHAPGGAVDPLVQADHHRHSP